MNSLAQIFFDRPFITTDSYFGNTVLSESSFTRLQWPLSELISNPWPARGLLCHNVNCHRYANILKQLLNRSRDKAFLQRQGDKNDQKKGL